MSRRRYDGRDNRSKHYAGRGGDTSAGGCLVLAVMAIVAMPFCGLILILKKDGTDATKALGWVLLILGIFLWTYFLITTGGK